MVCWFCDVGGTICASVIEPVGVERVAVVEHAARRLGARRSRVPARGVTVDARRRRAARSASMMRSASSQRVDDLDRAHDDALERVAARAAEARPRAPPAAPSASAGRSSGCSAPAGRRGTRRGRAIDRVQRVRVLDVLLDEVPLVLADGDVEPAARDDAALVERVLVGVRAAPRTRSRARSRGTRSPPTHAHRLERRVARPLQRSPQRRAARASSARV